MKKVIICYVSFSGNTEEVAELVGVELERDGCVVDYYEIGVDRPLFSVEDYDLMFLGTFTWNQGCVPDNVKDFAYDLGYKPENVAVFGTGDTQFGGDDLYCLAVDKLAKFYESNYPVLKIEQSPRGSQELLVRGWVRDNFCVGKEKVSRIENKKEYVYER